MVMAILWDNMLDSNVKPGRTWYVHAQQVQKCGTPMIFGQIQIQQPSIFVMNSEAKHGQKSMAISGT